MPLSSSETICKHCGTPFHPQKEGEVFCCTGCAYVYELINNQNLCQYYDLRSGPVPPVGNRVFHPSRYGWLKETVERAENANAAAPETTLRIQGLSCAACVWLVEQIFNRQPGSLQTIVNASTGRVRLRWEAGKFDAIPFAEDLNRFGYSIGPDDGSRHDENSSLTRRIGLCGAFAMNAMLFSLPYYLGLQPSEWLSPILDAIALLCATLSLIVGGSYFIRRAWLSLRSGVLHIDFPIALGLLVGYAATLYAWIYNHRELAYFDFVSIFTFLMLTGRWLQERVAESNRNRLLGVSSVPSTVTLIAGDNALPVPLAQIQPRMRLRINPGGVVPVRSRLLEGSFVFGLEWISGESESREFKAGAVLPSGSFNLSMQPVEVETLEPWTDSLLRALTAESSPVSSHVEWMNRIIRTYLATVVVIAFAGGISWWLAGHHRLALQVLVSTLVVSCPCAIGVSLPLADELATAFGRRLGCFVRISTLWPRLRRVRAVAFDKTGTLTLDVPQLRDPAILSTLNTEDRGALELIVATSLHPVGKSLRESLLISGLANVRPANPFTLEEIPGAGVSLQSGGITWQLGRPEWVGSEATTAECAFSRNGQPLATFSFSETLRPDALEQVEQLQRKGYSVWLLSGDRREKVESLARQLHLPEDHILAEATPQEKAETLQRIKLESLMIGDGANDSLAFNQALCSGTPAIDRGLLENRADFYFTGMGLQGLNGLLDIARQHGRAVRRVMAFTISYNVCAVALAQTGYIIPLVAAVLMPASAVLSLSIVALTLRTTAIKP
jgi:P-type Cu2+ transporter